MSGSILGKRGRKNMTDFDQLRADLARMREELTSKIHLGSKDAQARWAEFEKKWEQFAAEAELRQSGEDIGAAARALGDELKTGFEGIKKALR